MFVVMKEHGTQCNSVVHWCVFNSIWTTMDVSWTVVQAISGFGYRKIVGALHHCLFTGLLTIRKILVLNRVLNVFICSRERCWENAPFNLLEMWKKNMHASSPTLSQCSYTTNLQQQARFERIVMPAGLHFYQHNKEMFFNKCTC